MRLVWIEAEKQGISVIFTKKLRVALLLD